jgi:bifunctional NMN adenylyltransferase/nudix hydrolase
MTTHMGRDQEYYHTIDMRNFPQFQSNPPLIIQPKPFKLGFMLGRFQHIHIAHEMIINKALTLCDKVIILVGSEQAEGTQRNPFSASVRKGLIDEIYNLNVNVVVGTIPDMTNEDDHCHAWGRFVLQYVANIADYNGIKTNPDLMIYGNDEERSAWFDPEDIAHISQLIINKGDIDISATRMRQWMIENNFYKWRQFANGKIHGEFPYLRDRLLKIDFYKEMLKNGKTKESENIN